MYYYRHNLCVILIMSCTVFQSYTSTPSLTPDDDVFKHLALTYSRNHPTMNQGVACKAGTPTFNNGITNGAAWYPLTGKNRSNDRRRTQSQMLCYYVFTTIYNIGTCLITYYYILVQDDYFNCCTAKTFSLSQKVSI